MPEREIDLQSLQPNSEAEEFVHQEVEAGRVADLKEKFPEEASRAISASFLQEIILREGLPRKGVRVRGAVVLGGLDLETSEIDTGIVFEESIFRDNVNIRDARVHRAISFDGSTIRGEFDCHRLISDSNVFLNNVKFHRRVDLASADLGDRLSADGATFYSKANFNGLKAQGVFIKGAVFHSLVDFSRAYIGVDLDANPLEIDKPKSKIKTEFKLEANFNGIRVGGNVFIVETIFRGPVDFNGADIGTQIAADGAKFMNEKAKVLFNGTNVGRDILFRNGVEFKGPVDFTLMRVVGTASFKGAVFHKAAIFAGAYVGSRFSADGAKFKAEANFNVFKGGESVYFSQEDESKSSNAEFIGPADFTMIEVAKSLIISNAVFHNTVTFAGVNIGFQLLANGSKFLAKVQKEPQANFHGIEVGQGAFFRGTMFAGPVDIGSAELQGILFEDIVLEENEPSPLVLRLDRTVISKVLQIVRTRLGALSAQDLKAATIELVDTTLPEKVNLDIEGMTYDRISIWKNKSEDFKFFREFLERARYSRQPYQQMAQFFRQKKGHVGSWRHILIDMHRRERREKAVWRRLWSYIFDETIRFGYAPGRVLIWSALVVAIGWCAYNQNTLDIPIGTSRPLTDGNRLWYSLGLFLPALQLPIIKAWANITIEHWFSWFWANLQPALGWFVAALGATALTRWMK